MLPAEQGDELRIMAKANTYCLNNPDLKVGVNEPLSQRALALNMIP